MAPFPPLPSPASQSLTTVIRHLRAAHGCPRPSAQSNRNMLFTIVLAAAAPDVRASKMEGLLNEIVPSKRKLYSDDDDDDDDGDDDDHKGGCTDEIRALETIFTCSAMYCNCLCITKSIPLLPSSTCKTQVSESRSRSLTGVYSRPQPPLGLANRRKSRK